MRLETRGNILASSLTLLIAAVLVSVCMTVRTEPGPRYNTVRIFLSQGIEEMAGPSEPERAVETAPVKPVPPQENPAARIPPESPPSDASGSVFDSSEERPSTSEEPSLNSALSAQGSAQRKTSSSSGRTAGALSGVASVAETQGARGITSAGASVSGGRYSMEFSDGSMRELISPDRPVIFISDDSARLLFSSQTVEVSFMVLGNGRVPPGSVEIRPASVLPEPVRNEITGQVSGWIFSSDARGNSATGRFVYTIEVR